MSVKSGPNQYNSSQKKRQNDEFQTLRSRLMKIKKQFDAILGHGYGRLKTEPSKNRIYRDISGQRLENSQMNSVIQKEPLFGKSFLNLIVAWNNN
ncbi:hypothetical protein HZC34_04955 [Candidatus Saganbacteria bacterium]|nr:hypothetical protein [Candidatus Saganbacteria bacterium]